MTLEEPTVGNPPPRPADPAPRENPLRRVLAPVAALAVLIAKYGVLLVKIKAVSVVLTMGVSVVAYATFYGWRFAVGFVLLIFVHEMGHVVALRNRGIKAGAPVFLPFLGAFVSMKEQPKDAYVEAETALAGPIVGSLGALLVALTAVATNSGLLRALAFTGFLINLFNLLPALPLDGGRAAAALHPAAWLLGLVALVLLEIVAPSPVLPIIILLGGLELWRRWRSRNDPDSRRYHAVRGSQRAGIAVVYLALIAALVVAVHSTYVPRSL